MFLYSSTPLKVWIQHDEETKALIAPHSDLTTEKKKKIMNCCRAWAAVCAAFLFGIVVLYATIAEVLTEYDERCLGLHVVIWVRVATSLAECLVIYKLYSCDLNPKQKNRLVLGLTALHFLFFGLGLGFSVQCPFGHRDMDQNRDAAKIWGAFVRGVVRYGYICVDFVFAVLLMYYAMWNAGVEQKGDWPQPAPASSSPTPT